MREDYTLRTALAKAPGYLVKTVDRRIAEVRLARYFRRHPDHRAVSEADAADAVRGADRLLFLCWGNICRSPLAERYCRSRLAEEPSPDVSVSSSGLGQYEGRESPEDAVASARRFDVDLADHRSSRLSPDRVEAADAVLVMDAYNFHLLSKRYPDAVDRTFFLRVFADDAGDPPFIPDPHGRGRERFDEVYATVVDAVDGMVEVLREVRERPQDSDPGVST